MFDKTKKNEKCLNDESTALSTAAVNTNNVIVEMKGRYLVYLKINLDLVKILIIQLIFKNISFK